MPEEVRETEIYTHRVSSEVCHCEERSDVAIRILKNYRFYTKSPYNRNISGTDCHTSLRTGSQ